MVFSQAVKVYSKAMPLANYAAIENVCRNKGFNVYLIGLVSWKSISLVHFDDQRLTFDVQDQRDCEILGHH